MSSRTFSLQTLFAVVTGAAVICGIGVTFGPPFAIFAGFVVFLIYAAIAAQETERSEPFGYALASGTVLWIFAVNFSSNYKTELQVVFESILIAAGTFLCYRAIRYGHWATRLLGVLLAFFFLWFYEMIFSYGIANQQFVIDYWTSKFE